MILHILYHFQLILYYVFIDEEKLNLHFKLQINQIREEIHYITNVHII